MGIFLNIVIYIIIFLMGVTVFSYMNYVIIRLSKNESLTQKHSSCRYCGKKFPFREILIEILGGILAVISVFFYGISIQSLFVFLVMCDLTVISFVDADIQIIPPVLNYILLIFGVISIWIIGAPGIIDRIIGLFCISLPMFVIVLLFDGFGGGDIKLMTVSGLLLGWKGNVAAFFIGVILGGIYGIYLLVSKKKGKKDFFAFGPFLCLGIIISFIQGFGELIVQGYIDAAKTLISFF